DRAGRGDGQHIPETRAGTNHAPTPAGRRAPGRAVPINSPLVLRPAADGEIHLRAVGQMLAGGRALAEDASLLLLGRLRPRHLADLAVRRYDLRLRGHELLADHLRDDTAGRRRLLVEGRGDALGA